MELADLKKKNEELKEIIDSLRAKLDYDNRTILKLSNTISVLEYSIRNDQVEETINMYKF